MPSPGQAAVALIIFGGGWGAEGTQASIETHVLALKSAFASRAPRVMFASGDPAIRDVQISVDQPDEASALLGVIFDRRDHLHVAYRPAKTDGAGTASKRALLEAIASTAGNAAGTIVFGVGHGAPETKDERAGLELFGPDDHLSVEDLARSLDQTPRKAPIAFVLGHCHSGAFSAVSFLGADPKARVAEPARCVLAAVPGERQAAGCSSDADDPDARAYVAMIAEAFAKNPKATLAEAHTYARINDRTIDVPVASSELWMIRALGKKMRDPKSIALDKLLPRARASEREVLVALLPSPSATPRSVHAELGAMDIEMDRLDRDLETLRDEYDDARRRLVDAVLLRYPELANPYHVEARRLVAGNATELVSFVRARRELLEMDAKDGEMQPLEARRFDLEKKAARLERWLNAAVAVSNEDTLRRSGNKTAVRVLDRLLACESLAP